MTHELTPLQPSGYTRHLGQYQLDVFRGMDENLAMQIFARSSSLAIRSKFPGDAEGRFSTIDSTLDWYERTKPEVYSLAHGKNLAGIAIFSHGLEIITGATSKLELRKYSPIDKVFMMDLGHAGVVDYQSTIGSAPTLWGEVMNGDTEAWNVYRNLGFVATENLKLFTVMKRPPTTRTTISH